MLILWYQWMFLKESVSDALKTAIFIFRVISDRMNFARMEGAAIQNDLGKLIYHFKDENETSVNIMQIMGVRHSVTLLNLPRL